MTIHNKPDSETVSDTPIVTQLRNHALPDPYDEREVVHAPLLREAADRIEQLECELNEANKKLATARNDALEHAAACIDTNYCDSGVVFATAIRALKSNSSGSGE